MIDDLWEAQNRKLVRRVGCAYRTCLTNTLVFVHPSSMLFKCEKPPQFVAFQELMKTSRRFMKGITAVSAEWLVQLAPDALCNWGDPLDVPPPKYESDQDTITCVVRPTFGRHRWVLPVQKVPFPTSSNLFYQFFARFLFEGEIVAGFKEYSLYFNAQPSLITKAAQLPKVDALVRTLSEHGITSRQTLINQW
eukprot:CAMPEP_0201562940 /NCGR_PEP_ID=MMETSP0173_2-20130828/79608_1 /ASSEMBLY_ACC=CAM_ASM_000268 /TAXON_ID=218659 /ORGANISM="Vexillifera sp., Strain DIVA3 564/2" /LENGTH=192 /DNA_ID=CAMNT_0047977563 /DNA_START=320 /DNA_END=895 /DNA_ORIENTATION=+